MKRLLQETEIEFAKAQSGNKPASIKLTKKITEEILDAALTAYISDTKYIESKPTSWFTVMKKKVEFPVTEAHIYLKVMGVINKKGTYSKKHPLYKQIKKIYEYEK